MKEYRVRFTPEAVLCISRLHPDHQRIIRDALDQLRREPYAGDDLREELAEFKSSNRKDSESFTLSTTIGRWSRSITSVTGETSMTNSGFCYAQTSPHGRGRRRTIGRGRWNRRGRVGVFVRTFEWSINRVSVFACPDHDFPALPFNTECRIRNQQDKLS